MAKGAKGVVVAASTAEKGVRGVAKGALELAEKVVHVCFYPCFTTRSCPMTILCDARAQAAVKAAVAAERAADTDVEAQRVLHSVDPNPNRIHRARGCLKFEGGNTTCANEDCSV